MTNRPGEINKIGDSGFSVATRGSDSDASFGLVRIEIENFCVENRGSRFKMVRKKVASIEFNIVSKNVEHGCFLLLWGVVGELIHKNFSKKF